MNLIIDDRERVVLHHLERTLGTNPAYENKFHITRMRLDTGDYCITYNNVPVFLIERKTWNDMAASIKDGRKENVNKMLLFREQNPGTKLIYLIEGQIQPGRDRVNGIAVKSINAHLDHLIQRDDIHIMYTKSITGTILRLFEFGNNYINVAVRKETKCDEVNDFILKRSVELNRPDPSELETKIEHLRRIPGIGSACAENMIRQGIHIGKLLCDDSIGPDELSGIKIMTVKK